MTPRHPSQIYEAFLEGVVLFYILNIYYIKKKLQNRDLLLYVFDFIWDLQNLFQNILENQMFK